MDQDPARWDRLSRALADVLSQRTADRTRALAGHFERDPTLREDLEALVRSSDAARSYFEALQRRIGRAGVPVEAASSELREETRRLLEATRSGGLTAAPVPTAADGSIVQDVRFCATVDRVQIAFATTGRGPPLVKVANWLSHLEFDAASPVWRHWLIDLARDHTLVRYDERGCGLSDRDVDFSFEHWVSDLEAVVDHLQLERFPLLGISQGGPVAIEYAVRHPERVSHLILYGSYATGWAKQDLDDETRAAFEAQIALSAHGWGRKNPAYRQLFTSLFIPGASPTQAEWFNELQQVSTSPENAVRFQREFSTIDVSELLSRVSAPTLVLHARNDARIPFASGRTLGRLIPNARFVALESDNHLILEDEPAWSHFLREVRRFLGVDSADGRTTGASAESESATVARPRPDDDLAGLYRIEREVARGGMATIYEAHDLRHSRTVAVKVFDAAVTRSIDPRRFKREIRVTSRLVHPNILPLLDSGAVGESLYYVTPLLGEGSLQERLRVEPRLELDQVVTIASDVAAALSHAHGQGVIHRDVKPANVLLAEGRAMLADFGVARVVSNADSQLTRPGSVIGTLKYISPEQLRGDAEIGTAADVYGLGCVVFEMICSVPPFTGTPEELIYSHLREVPVRVDTIRADLPPAMAAAVARTLSKRPNERPTADEFAAELSRGAPDRHSAGTRRSLRAEDMGRRFGLSRSVLWTGLGLAAVTALVLSSTCIN